MSSQYIMISSSGSVRECWADIVSDDVAIHHTLEYVGENKWDFVGKGYTITHIPTGWALVVLGDEFAWSTAFSIARKFSELLQNAPKYEGQVSDQDLSNKWIRDIYKFNPEIFEYHKALRFYQEGNGYLWIKNWYKINQDKWRK